MSSGTPRAEYRSPLSSRYATAAMLENFSDRRRALLWRDLWLALARSEAELGLPITQAQIDALVKVREDIDFEKVAEWEASLRHDVMAHVHHYSELAGKDAAGIIHLGATSCFVTDNADLLLFRRALGLVEQPLLGYQRLGRVRRRQLQRDLGLGALQ